MKIIIFIVYLIYLICLMYQLYTHQITWVQEVKEMCLGLMVQVGVTFTIDNWKKSK